MATSAPIRAHGRSLADFEPLWPMEEALLHGCRTGEGANAGVELPATDTPATHVRADFVRFLLLGGDERAPVHEHGVLMGGAWLAGTLDLDAATVEHRLILVSCRIEQVDARDSHLKFLALNGCLLVGDLNGEGLSCPGGVYLRDGFHATGAVRLPGAKIGGSLDCDGGCFERGSGFALDCYGAAITGYVSLGRGFQAAGEVRLSGAAIGGHLHCGGGRFMNGPGTALSCDSLKCSLSVSLHEGFHATGMVQLDMARIGVALSCEGGIFDCPQSTALSCQGTQVGEAFVFRSVQRVDGAVVLSGMRVTSLCDDEGSWRGAQGRLVLDGFTYARLAGGAPTDAATRIAWLDRQYPDELRKNFRPQPWEQAVTVLRAMGHPDQARAVAIAKQERMRRAGRLPGGARPFHWLYGLLVGYGYRPMRLLAATAVVWILCAVAYWWAANPGAFGPSTHLIAPPNREAPAPDYRNFVPLIYSADVLLPVVDLGYKNEWQPVVRDARGEPLVWGQALRFLYWFEIAFGWVAGLLLVGVLGTLIKKD